MVTLQVITAINGAEVLEADAFEVFKEEGLFNQKVADRFYLEILSRGGVEDPSILYRNFRGRDPHINALLKRSGLAYTDRV